MRKPFIRSADPSSWRVMGLLLAFSAAVLALTLLAAILSSTRAQAGTLCVKPGGGDGCLASITAALAAAADGDTIQVAAGTYVENVLISRTLTLQGGWSPDFSARDLEAFRTTITPADNTQSVVSIQGQFGDPSAVAPTLDGFVITGGRADLGGNHGGGLRIVRSNALVISNTIKDNVAFLLGGGVWVQRGAPTLRGNHVISNYSLGLGQDAHGGGVQLENTQAALMDNLISGNIISGTEGYGGGIEVSGTGVGQVVLRRNRFISNTASLKSGTLGFGGAVAVINGRVLLEDSSLISNTAATSGGGIFVGRGEMRLRANSIISNSAREGGGMFVGEPGADAYIATSRDNLFRRNAAVRGGGLYNNGRVALLGGGAFISNTASADGGAVFIAPGGAISLTNSAAIANRAARDGGAIHNSGFISISNTTISGNSASGRGGGIANLDVINLVNATVSDNASADGAAFFNDNMVNTKNSLIALNTGDNCLGVLNSQGNNLEDGGTCALGQPTDKSNTAPSMNPLGDNGGPTPTHALAADSPAIDAGDNAACAPTDQRGVSRPVDGDLDGDAVCDIGAFEYQTPSITTILADDPDPSPAGEPFTVTFSVTATLGTPSGAVTVTVSDDPGSCTGTLSGGMGGCAFVLSVPGTYTLAAAFVSDDGDFAPSSATEVHTVETSDHHLYLPVVLREG